MRLGASAGGIARCLAEAGAIVYVTGRVLHVADLAREYGFTAPVAHSLRGRGARRRYPAGTPGRPVGLEPALPPVIERPRTSLAGRTLMWLLRLTFVALIGGALGYGLNWSLNPDDRPDAGAVTYSLDELRDDETETATEAATAPDEPAADATPTPSPTSTEEPAEVLIGAARAPSDTTVQVLNAGAGDARTDAAVTVVEALGYNVVAISPSRRDVSETTVYFTDGNEPEAKALRARDPRFQAVEENQGLSEGVDLHVLVGTDWR